MFIHNDSGRNVCTFTASAPADANASTVSRASPRSFPWLAESSATIRAFCFVILLSVCIKLNDRLNRVHLVDIFIRDFLSTHIFKLKKQVEKVQAINAMVTQIIFGPDCADIRVDTCGDDGVFYLLLSNHGNPLFNGSIFVFGKQAGSPGEPNSKPADDNGLTV